MDGVEALCFSERADDELKESVIIVACVSIV